MNSMRTVGFRAFILAALTAPTVLHGCAYSRHFNMPPGAQNLKTIAVQIFANRTTYVDVENQFTDALRREISQKTRLSIADRGQADSVLSGRIDAYTRKVLREDDTDQVTRYSIILTVTYTFTRLPSTGQPEKVIKTARGLQRSAEYEVLSPITEADARAEAVAKIARKVVSHIFETW